MEGNTIKFIVSEEERAQKLFTDDIYDELIEIRYELWRTMPVFLPKGEFYPISWFWSL